MKNFKINPLKLLKDRNWYTKPYTIQLFIHLFINANTEDETINGIEIKRGQLITTNKALKKETCISDRSIRTCLTRMIQTNDVTIKSTNKYSIITICEYELYIGYNVDKKTRGKTIKNTIEMSPDKISFDEFWNLYDKKVGYNEKLINKWNKLPESEKKLIFEYIPKYKIAQPDKQYRKNPETFLNNKSWNDELINKKDGFKQKFTSKNPATSDTELATNIAEGINRGIRDKHIQR
jgi:hypothetical protein